MESSSQPRLGRTVPVHPAPECVVATSAVVRELEDVRMVPRMVGPLLEPSGRDPDRRPAGRPRLPDHALPQNLIEECGEERCEAVC